MKMVGQFAAKKVDQYLIKLLGHIAEMKPLSAEGIKEQAASFVNIAL